MIVIAGILALALALSLPTTVYLMLRYKAAAEAAWFAERRELLTRIQKPEYVPVANQEPYRWPEDEHEDEFNLVGTIQEPKADE